jgi:hypothetical protein
MGRRQGTASCRRVTQDVRSKRASTICHGIADTTRGTNFALSPPIAERRSIWEMSGEAMREIGVLVMVFGHPVLQGMLDAKGAATPSWILAAVAFGLLLFSIGCTIEKVRR